MFGYVTVCKEGLSEEAYRVFRDYYCGLCKTTGKRCSHLSRAGLSYDITFLALMLSAVDAEDGQTIQKRCALHPRRDAVRVPVNRAMDYAADAGVMATYLKLIDDWKDGRSIKSLFAIPLFYFGMKRAKKRLPALYGGINGYLKKLCELEKSGCGDIDKTADCFAKILELLFTPDFIEDTAQRRALAWLGYNIGRWIYVMDAYSDILKDAKRGEYNPFLIGNGGKSAQEIKNGLKEQLTVSMTFTLENAASAYDLLTVRKNREVLDNIIYVALKNKQDYVLGENNESL